MGGLTQLESFWNSACKAPHPSLSLIKTSFPLEYGCHGFGALGNSSAKKKREKNHQSLLQTEPKITGKFYFKGNCILQGINIDTEARHTIFMLRSAIFTEAGTQTCPHSLQFITDHPNLGGENGWVDEQDS